MQLTSMKPNIGPLSLRTLQIHKNWEGEEDPDEKAIICSNLIHKAV